MKWFALVILLLSAAAGAYVLTQGDSERPKSKEKSAEDRLPPEGDDEAEEAPSQAAKTVGAVEEVILPPGAEGAAKPEGADEAKAGPDTATEGRKRRKKPKTLVEEAPAPEIAERPAPSSREAPASPSSVSRGSSSSTQTAGETAGSTAPNPASGTTGNGLGNGPLIGGISIPAGASSRGSGGSSGGGSSGSFGAPIVSRPPTSAASPGSSSSSSSAKPRPEPTVASAPKGGEPAPVEKKATTEESAAQPVKYAPPEEAKEKPGDQGDFAGLLVTPPSIAAAAPNDPEKKVVAVYSLKSGWNPQDKVAVEIYRECDLTATTFAAACDNSVPEGGPTVLGYLLGATLSKDDLLPDSKGLDIGTTVVGAFQDPETGRETPLAEVAFQIDPGRVPGRYLLRVRGPGEKSFQGLLEVTAAALPPAPAPPPVTKPL